MPDPPKLDPTLREIFKVAYSYRLKYQNPDNTEAFWKAAVMDANTICNQFNRHPFCSALMMACYEDIEREVKTKTDAANGQREI